MTAELRLTPNSFPVFGLFYVLLPFFSINVEKKYLSGKVTFLFQSTSSSFFISRQQGQG